MHDTLHNDKCARIWKILPTLRGKGLRKIGWSFWAFHIVKRFWVVARPVMSIIGLNGDCWKRTWVVVEGSNRIM